MYNGKTTLSILFSSFYSQPITFILLYIFPASGKFPPDALIFRSLLFPSSSFFFVVIYLPASPLASLATFLNKSEFYQRNAGPEASGRETRGKIKGSRTNPFSDGSNEDEWRNRAKIYRGIREEGQEVREKKSGARGGGGGTRE